MEMVLPQKPMALPNRGAGILLNGQYVIHPNGDRDKIYTPNPLKTYCLHKFKQGNTEVTVIYINAITMPF